jgi:hypothetical protein
MDPSRILCDWNRNLAVIGTNNWPQEFLKAFLFSIALFPRLSWNWNRIMTGRAIEKHKIAMGANAPCNSGCLGKRTTQIQLGTD